MKKTTDNVEIQRILKDYYEQLYGNKMDNLEEMDRFLEKFNLPRLNQEETEVMNSQITIIAIEAVIKNLPKNKSPGLDGFTGEPLACTWGTRQTELTQQLCCLERRHLGSFPSSLVLFPPSRAPSW